VNNNTWLMLKTQQKDERKDTIVPVIVPRRGMQGQGDDLCAHVVRIYFFSCVFRVPYYHLQAAPAHMVHASRFCQSFLQNNTQSFFNSFFPFCTQEKIIMTVFVMELLLFQLAGGGQAAAPPWHSDFQQSLYPYCQRHLAECSSPDPSS
jgi:hypothetical protein